MRDVADKEIKLWSDDTLSEFVLRLAPDLLFESADPRDFPEDAKLFSRGIGVLFPSKDAIYFSEFIET